MENEGVASVVHIGISSTFNVIFLLLLWWRVECFTRKRKRDSLEVGQPDQNTLQKCLVGCNARGPVLLKSRTKPTNKALTRSATSCPKEHGPRQHSESIIQADFVLEEVSLVVQRRVVRVQRLLEALSGDFQASGMLTLVLDSKMPFARFDDHDSPSEDLTRDLYS